ncbi:helix-turn-helix transcriptional regulator [Oscillatoria laete-virens NRMC-F 0139]|nr:helix-turn-helix transcriptional regulator [Oscillatoria laete-virens]MDL5052691.1 helix-turn-helix transcriptional regulator [Oscillatoria laete-virens NRMC-F 0139]
MSPAQSQDATHSLLELMQRVGISSFKALSRVSGVSERQLLYLRRAQVQRLRIEVFFKLAPVLQVPVGELLATFAGVGEASGEVRQAYERLEAQLQVQRQELLQEFQQASLDTLETWLRNWPIAVAKVKEGTLTDPMTLVRLVQPVEKLMQQWGVEPLAQVGDEVAYDPQWHTLNEGSAQPGDRAIVKRPGFRQADKLLHRSLVVPLKD